LPYPHRVAADVGMTTISHKADIMSVLLHSAHINPGLHAAFRYYHVSM